MSEYIEVDGLRVGPNMWRSLKEQLEQAEARVCRQNEYLKSLVSICTKQAKLLDSSVDPLVELTEHFLRSGEIDAGPHRSWLLRKQAEAVEDMADCVNPDNPHRSLREEAQRLRNQADEAEKSGGPND